MRSLTLSFSKPQDFADLVWFSEAVEILSLSFTAVGGNWKVRARQRVQRLSNFGPVLFNEQS
jgi:hypothetical protein